MENSEIILNFENKIKALEANLALANARCEQFSQAYDMLVHQMQELLRNRFGKKSERFVDPEHPQQDLFENLGETFAKAEASGKALDDITIPAHKRKKVKSKKEVLRRVVIIPLSEEEKRCGCGACKNIIRYEIKNILNYQPGVFEIIEQRREVAACPQGCNGEIVTAPAPLHVLPKTKITGEFLAFLATGKTDDRQPLYHLEKNWLNVMGSIARDKAWPVGSLN